MRMHVDLTFMACIQGALLRQMEYYLVHDYLLYT